jgi:ABC-type nitrate/sulfonate/bicarbonate transport system ATPase subunit
VDDDVTDGPPVDGTRPDATVGGRDVRLVGVGHRYAGGDLVALERIDLDIEAGSFVSIVGPSGCGKTTLLQIVAGFLRPTVGAVSVGGRPVVAPGSDRGVVFQHPTSLYPWLTVLGNVELGLRLRRVPKRERRARAMEELDRVGLADVAERRPYELSGGMQQRCQIARVLANDPDVMLMDEPFGAIDALTRERLQDELRELWAATGRTVVFITHGVDEAVLLGTRVLVMSPRPGRVILDLPLAFSRSTRPASDLRAAPEFVATVQRVREAITEASPADR